MITKTIFREMIRWYLRRFPLRDGKRLIFDLLNEALAPPASTVDVKVKAGFSLRLDLKEPAQRLIYFFGNYDERHEIAMLRQVLAPGDVFWDVGANIGFYTLTASGLVGEDGSVVAFEPGPASWEALLANLDLNRARNVTPFHLAVAESLSWVTLYSQPELADGGASIVPRPAAGLRADRCPAVSLDYFLQEQGHKAPTFIKIDVEGAEDRVLQGARSILSDPCPPLLLIEMNDRETVGHLLKGLGFAGVHLNRGRWHPCPDPALAASRNMLWFHPDCDWHRARLTKIMQVNP